MTVNPETVNSDSNSDNDEQHGQTQQGRGEVNQAEVTGQVPEGTGQAQDQGDTGATGGQEEHQNNGTTEGQQNQTTAQVNTEGQTQGAESLEERRSSNRNLLRRFLQEVDEDTQATPSLRDRERHRRISRNTVPSLRDAMRQSVGGPGVNAPGGLPKIIPFATLNFMTLSSFCFMCSKPLKHSPQQPKHLSL